MMVIVDYGLGNLGSVANMLRRIGVRARVSSSTEDIAAATALILPGVGAFDVGMANLEARGLRSALEARVLGARVPVLGICLGMQLLTRGSEEGRAQGLGWVGATTRRLVFERGSELPVPHMGWNDTTLRDHQLFHELPAGTRFYYVHSFHVVCDDPATVAASCVYGHEICAAVRSGNVFGTQFHPEKSHRFGMQVLRNFARIAETWSASA